jgi:hypothetical protein
MRQRMVECSLFEVVVKCDERILYIDIKSDLPAGTRVIVSVFRTYRNLANEEELWQLLSEAIFLESLQRELNGFSLSANIDELDGKAKEYFKSVIPSCPRGMTSLPSELINIRCSVGARQKLKLFGKMNKKLRGNKVVASGGINLVEGCSNVILPISEENLPINKDNVSGC